MRLRTWLIGVFAPVVTVGLALIVLLWHPIPARKSFGDHLLVDGHRVALPLEFCGWDTFADGGSHVMACVDRERMAHLFICRAPGYRQVTYQTLGKIEIPQDLGQFGYGAVVTNDRDVRNVLYWTLHETLRKSGSEYGIGSEIRDLYPSLWQQWFSDLF